MNPMQTCPQCGAKLDAEAPEGICPACLMKAGLATRPSTPMVEPIQTQTLNPAVGTTVHYFGDYELLEEIARGGMGVVYKARQASLNRIVALKMILSGQLASEAEVKRFRVEAEAAANLQHPNIVAIHEVGMHDGRHYFTMDFVEGRNLAQVAGGQPMAAQRAAGYVQTMAEAIHFAHQRGTLHRDLKPQNVLIDRADHVRITDFGLAKKIHGDDSGLTQSGAVMGSPSYMSPEQATGKAKEVTTAADVYSLGAVLYELLTGQPPFRGESAVETMRKVVEEEPKSPRALNRAVDRDLETVCLKCLEKDAARRYASADALANDLGRWLRNEPVLARPATALDRARKWARRSPAQAVAVGVAMAAVVVFVAGMFVANRQLNSRLWQSLVEQARAERLTHNRTRSLEAVAEAARIRVDARLQDEAIQTLAQAGARLERRVPYGKEAWFSLSNDGSLLMAAGMVHSWPDGKEITTPKVRVYETASGRLLNETAWEPMGALPAFSSDARVVAVPQPGKAVAIWEPRTGRELARVAGEGALAFSPDGEWLALAGTNSFKVVRWAGATEEKLRPRGAFLMFASNSEALVSDDKRIVKWNFRDGAETPLTPAGMAPLAVNPEGKFAALWDKGTNQAMGSIVVFDMVAQKQRAVLPTLRSISIPARFNADGRLLAFSDPTGLLDNSVGQQSVRIWDVEAGTYRPSLVGRSLVLGPYTVLRSWWQSSGNKVDFDAASPLAIYGGQFIGDGSLFAAVTGISERGVTVWNTETGEPVAELPKSFEFAFSADGRLAASQGEGTFIHFPNGVSYAIDRDDSIIAQTAGVPTPASELPKGRQTGTGGLFIQLWSLAAAVPTYQKETEVRRLAFSRDGRMLAATGYSGGQVPSRLWTVTARDGRLTLHPNKSLSIEGALFFAGTNQVWEQTTIFTKTSGTMRLRSLVPERKDFSDELQGSYHEPVFSPDGRVALVGTYTLTSPNNMSSMTNQTFQLWDVATAKPIRTQSLTNFNWAGSGSGPSVFSPDGRRIASTRFVREGLNVYDATTLALLWNAAQVRATERQGFRSRLGRFFGEDRDEYYSESLVQQIAFTPDSRRVVYVSQHHLNIRDAETGAELGIGCGPNYLEYLQALAVSPDGKFAVTGGVDRMIRVWDIPTARELARWEAHDSDVTALAFSPDGATLASASKQGALKLWNLPALRAELRKLGLDW